MKTLLDILSKTTATDEHVSLYDALVYAHKAGWLPDGRYDTAMRFRSAGAMESAALLLVPPHYSYELTQSAVEPPALSRCRLWDWRRSPRALDHENEWKAEGNQPLSTNICIASLMAWQVASAHNAAQRK